MRKKTIMSAFAIAIVAMTAFAGYKTMSHQSTAADLMLDENVEALTQEEEPTILCGGREHKGRCWEREGDVIECQGIVFYQCRATGNPADFCWHPCL